jgi:hypothetical protein
MEIDKEAQQLVEGPDLVDAIHAVCYKDFCRIMDMSMFRLQLIAAAWAEGDAVIQQAGGDNYAEVDAVWRPLHRRAAEAHNLTPREGISFEDLSLTMSALVEGLAGVSGLR